MLLVARPLQPHRPSGERHSEECSASSRIVGPIVAIATRAFNMNAAHFFLRQMQQFGDRGLQREHPLPVRPHGEFAILELGNGARWPNRAMHLIGPLECRGQCFAAGRYCRRTIRK